MYRIDLTEEQLERTIACIRTTIHEIERWNFDDEYDSDVVPFKELEKYFRNYLDNETPDLASFN